MHCASCVTIIERGLKKNEGVIKSNINLATVKASQPKGTGTCGISGGTGSAGCGCGMMG